MHVLIYLWSIFYIYRHEYDLHMYRCRHIQYIYICIYLYMVRIYASMSILPIFSCIKLIGRDRIVTQFDCEVELLHKRGSSTIDEPKWNIQKASVALID